MTRLVGVLLLVPLAAFSAEAWFGGGGFEFPARAWGRTLVVSGGAAAVSLLLGLPSGAILARSRGVVPTALTLVPVIVPQALGASAWIVIGGPSPGAVGCALILGLSTWPVVALLVAAALRRIPSGALEAAALGLDRFRMLRVVIWPEARPAAVAGALLVFFIAASDFSVTSTFAVRTVSVVLYERVSAFQHGTAAFVAFPLVVLAIVLASTVRKIPALPPEGRTRPFLGAASEGIAWIVTAAAWLVTALLPILFFAGSVSWAALKRVLADNAGSFAWSAAVAGAAALILVAWASLSPRRSRLESLWLAGLVLPPILAALGALRVTNLLGIQRPLMTSGTLIVWVLAARFAYVAWIPLRRPVGRSQTEAAELAGLSRWLAWRKIVFPSILPRALAVAAIVFALCLGEIGSSVLLNPPGCQTVVQHLFNLMHYGYDETVAALSLVLIGTAAALAGAGACVGRWRRSEIAV